MSGLNFGVVLKPGFTVYAIIVSVQNVTLYNTLAYMGATKS